MSKSYKVKMDIDVSNLHPSGGLLMRQMPKEADPQNPDAEFDSRGFKENTGAEVFEIICSAAILSSNPKCSYDQLKGFKKVKQLVKDGTKPGYFTANKTEIDLIKNSIKGHPAWPNTDEVSDVLDSILEKLNDPELGE